MDPERLAAVLAALARWVGYASITVIAGAAGFRLAVQRAWRVHAVASEASVNRRLNATALIAASILSVAMLGRLYAQAYSAFGVEDSLTWDSLRIVALDTAWGERWRWQLAAAVLAAILLMSLRWLHRAHPAMTAAAAIIVIATVPMTGHAVSRGSLTWLSVTMQIAHVGGMSLWLGTLFTILTLRRASGERAFAAAVRAFSPLALLAVGILAASGIVTSVVYLESVADLWSDTYGRVLLLKLLLFGVVAALGAYNWRKLSPSLDEPGPARTLTRAASTELTFAAATLVVTAVLVALPLPHE